MSVRLVDVIFQVLNASGDEDICYYNFFCARVDLHRQPKRTMCGFGLQRSFGLNILELLVYYLMLNKRKNLKDMKSSCLSICTSNL